MPKTTNKLVCYLCGCPSDEDDRCFGCKQIICEDCDEESPWGEHEPQEHKPDIEKEF